MPKRFFFDEGVTKRIGDKELEIRNRRRRKLWCRHQRLHFRDNPKLRHRERTKLKFKPDHAVRCSLDGSTHGAWTLIIRDSQCDAAQYPEQKCAGSDRRIGYEHI